MKKLIIILLVTIVATACGPSRSQRERMIKNIKVVVLDSKESTNNSIHHRHKVKNINDDVVTFVSLIDLYEKGDTILISKLQLQ